MTKDDESFSTGLQFDGRKKLIAWGSFFVGLIALFVLFSWAGFKTITDAISQGGFALLLLIFLYPIEIFPRAYSWILVYPKNHLPSHKLMIYVMWIGQSVNRLIPSASLGGDIIRGRILSLKGNQATNFITSLIADKTAHAVSVLILFLLGLILLMFRITDLRIIYGMIVAILILSLAIIFFLRLQRSSGVSAALKRFTEGKDSLLSGSSTAAEKIEEKLEKIYQNPGRFILSVSLRVVYTIALALEIWIAAWLMGYQISAFEAITLRVISFSVRSLAFVVWGGLGVQEGAYALLSTFVGLPPATLIAISLATRVREVAVALPGVFLWITGEGFHAIRSRKMKILPDEN
ncbi:MAG: lysylphosphatidylglycerol synthase domain-containing protein [Balneolaceae bacterium]